MRLHPSIHPSRFQFNSIIGLGTEEEEESTTDDEMMDRASNSGRSPLLLHNDFVADVVLWRRRNVSMGILLGTVSSWLFFHLSSSACTLLSLLSTVLLLLISILFLWAKAARLLNRPLPSVPEMRISELVVKEVATFLHSAINTVFSIFHDIALGKDSRLFYEVFACLWMISILGSLTDFPTFCYTSIVAILTIPALYVKYEECVDKYAKFAYKRLHMYERVYERVSIKCFNKVKNWIAEVLKET